MDFGTYLRDCRLQAKMSLRTLARKLDISAPFLSTVERGREGPFGPEYWPKLLRVLPGLDGKQLMRLYVQGKMQPGRRIDSRTLMTALRSSGSSPAQLRAFERMLGRTPRHAPAGK